MFHDRVAFGGTLLGVGIAYFFLAEFPLRAREAWAWWAFCVSGACGFLSFLTYLSYGYLDNWHGIATLFLLPVFLAGLWRARPPKIDWRDALQPGQPMSPGRAGLAFLSAGIVIAGMTIMVVGMTTVFVPQDLTFMRMTAMELRSISPRLVPVIAHDRAGFGGGLFSIGIILLFLTRHAAVTRSFVQTIALIGLAGFGCAIGCTRRSDTQTSFTSHRRTWAELYSSRRYCSWSASGGEPATADSISESFCAGGSTAA